MARCENNPKDCSHYELTTLTSGVSHEVTEDAISDAAKDDPEDSGKQVNESAVEDTTMDAVFPACQGYLKSQHTGMRETST